MPAVSRFLFYTDPVAKTGSSEVTIDWTAQTFTIPGPTVYPFSAADEIVDVIRDLADQDTSDGIGETKKEIYKADGTLQATITCAITAGTPPVVSTVNPGGVLSYDVVKAKDLAEGIETYILGL